MTVQIYRHQCTLSPPWRHPAACPAHPSSWPWPSPWPLTSRSRHLSWTRCCRWSAPSCPHVSPVWETVFTYDAKANIYIYFFCNYSITNEDKRYPHLKFFIGNTAWAAATTTRAVSAVLIVVLLRVLLGSGEAPPADGSSQWVAFQLQILLSWSSDVMKKCVFVQTGRADGVMPLTLSFSRSSLICWCSCSVSSWSPSWSYLAKMAWISASVWPFLRERRERQSGNTDVSHERWNENHSRAFFTLSDPDEVPQSSACRRPAVECQWCHRRPSSSASASSKLCYTPEREKNSHIKTSVHSLNGGGRARKETMSSSDLSQHSVKSGLPS